MVCVCVCVGLYRCRGRSGEYQIILIYLLCIMRWSSAIYRLIVYCVVIQRPNMLLFLNPPAPVTVMMHEIDCSMEFQDRVSSAVGSINYRYSWLHQRHCPLPYGGGLV